MGFLQSLFGKKGEPEGEPFIPTPRQNVPGLEPIIVQAIENLYPDIEQQKKVFKYALDYYYSAKFQETYHVTLRERAFRDRRV